MIEGVFFFKCMAARGLAANLAGERGRSLDSAIVRVCRNMTRTPLLQKVFASGDSRFTSLMA